jgi:hypothetical protein
MKFLYTLKCSMTVTETILTNFTLAVQMFRSNSHTKSYKISTNALSLLLGHIRTEEKMESTHKAHFSTSQRMPNNYLYRLYITLPEQLTYLDWSSISPNLSNQKICNHVFYSRPLDSVTNPMNLVQSW